MDSCWSSIYQVLLKIRSRKVVIKTVRTAKSKDSLTPPIPRSQLTVESPLVDIPTKRQSPPRPRFTFAALLNLLIFVISLAALAGGGFLDLFLNGGVEYGTNLPAYPYTSPADLNGANPLGVNTFLQLENGDTTVLDQSLDMIKAGGFGFARQEFAWDSIEPAAGVYTDSHGLNTWQAFDQLVAAAQARGVQIIARVDRAPVWSRQKTYDAMDTSLCNRDQITGPPDNLNDYGDFVAQLAQRYKGKIKYYQIWNEPNLYAEWNCKKVDPAQYTALLKIAYTRIKQVDPQAVILSAALAPTDQIGSKFLNLNELNYLDGMYKAGAKNYFDVMSAQIYGLGYSPDYRYVMPDFRYADLRRTNFSRTWFLHQVMVDNGDTSKPVWASEYAWISIPNNTPALSVYNNPNSQYYHSYGDNISPETQAQYLVQGIERARQEWPWLGVVNVWFFRADPTLYQNQDTNPQYYFSIVNNDFTPRPAYTALKEYAADAYKTAGIGYHPMGDPAISPQGSWTNSQAANNAKLTFTFQGDEADAVIKPLASGQVSVSLDDGPARTVNLSGNQVQRIVLAQDLPGGVAYSHRVQLVFSGSGSSPVAQIQGFYVERINYYGWVFILFYCIVGLIAAFSGGMLIARTVVGAPRLAVWGWYGTRRGGNWLAVNRRSLPDYYIGIAMGLSLLVFYFAPIGILSLIALILFLPLAFMLPQMAIAFALATAPLYAHPHNFRSAADPLEFSLNETIIIETMLAWGAKAVWTYWQRSFQARTVSVNNFVASEITTKFNFLAKQPLAVKWQRVRTWLKVQGPFALPLTLFFVLACVSLLVPDPPYLKYAIREFREVIIEPLLMYLLVVRFFKTSREAFRLLDFLMVSGVIISLIGLYEFVFNVASDVVRAEGVSRVVGVYDHPDNLGLFLGRVITIVACVVFFYKGGWNLRRKLYAAALVPLTLALILSFSRGAWLAVGITMLIVVLVVGSKRGLIVYGIGVVLAVAAIPFVHLQRITSLFSLDSGSNATRLDVWQSAIQMIHDHFFTGIGLDQFLYQYEIKYVNPNAWLERFISHPHNLVLDYWLRLGIIGPIVLAWLLFNFIKLALNLIRNYRDKSNNSKTKANRHIVALAMLASMLDFAIHGMVDNSYFLVDLAIIFCVEFAILETLRREALQDKEQT